MQIEKYLPVVELEGLTYAGSAADVEAFTNGQLYISTAEFTPQLRRQYDFGGIPIAIGDVIMRGATGKFFLVKKDQIQGSYTQCS